MKMPTIDLSCCKFFLPEFFLTFSKKEFAIVSNLRFISRTNFMLSWLEHEKSFITAGPVSCLQLRQILRGSMSYGTLKVLICLHILAVWSTPILSTYTITWGYWIHQNTAKTLISVLTNTLIWDFHTWVTWRRGWWWKPLCNEVLSWILSLVGFKPGTLWAKVRNPLAANHNNCRLLCHLLVILKVIFTNSVDPDQTAPLIRVHTVACMQK